MHSCTVNISSNKNRFFFLKKETETGSNRPVSVRFSYFREKTGSNQFGLVFSGLARFFLFWLGLFSVWLGFSPVWV
jgi:hypothetical protein